MNHRPKTFGAASWAPPVPWDRQDQFFLQDALRHGASSSVVAGFLLRDEKEVREKAEALGICTRRKAGRATLVVASARADGR